MCRKNIPYSLSIKSSLKFSSFLENSLEGFPETFSIIKETLFILINLIIIREIGPKRNIYYSKLILIWFWFRTLKAHLLLLQKFVIREETVATSGAVEEQLTLENPARTIMHRLLATKGCNIQRNLCITCESKLINGREKQSLLFHDRQILWFWANRISNNVYIREMSLVIGERINFLFWFSIAGNWYNKYMSDFVRCCR